MSRCMFVVAAVAMAMFQVLPAAADDQVGLFDPAGAEWYLRSGEGDTAHFIFGAPEDFPLVGDWDCDGVDTPGVYRRSDGTAYLRNSNSSGVADGEFVLAGPDAVPLAGDWNGDGCDTLALYERRTGRMFLSNALGEPITSTVYYFGVPGDHPFAGDFDGDGADELALHRENTGFVYIRHTHTQGIADNDFYYGNPGDCEIAGDWNGDGADSVGVFRPSNSTFYLRNSNSLGGADITFRYGDPSMIPVSGDFRVAGSGTAPVGSGFIECTSQTELARGAIGSGRFVVVAGSSARAGTGRLHRFQVEVEEGLPVDGSFFARSVESILLDRRGWIGGGSSFQRVHDAADFSVVLAGPRTATELCQPLDVHQTLSCRVGDMVVINFFRWTEAAAPFDGDLSTYRIYLVNHEVGHWLGRGHRGCPRPGSPAPVMMQQTLSVGSCLPNGWPTGSELD